MTDGRNWDVINAAGVTGSVTVGTSAVEAIVGGSVLDDRQFVRIYNDSNSVIYWSFNPSMTTSGANRGEPIEKKQWIEIPAGEQVPVYLRANSNGNSVIVMEGA